jgi:hypothetical protein
MEVNDMRPVFLKLFDIMIWLLFIKGVLLIPVTFYTIGKAFLAGEPTPPAGILSCAAGTFAFGMACFVIWLRSKLV